MAFLVTGLIDPCVLTCWHMHALEKILLHCSQWHIYCISMHTGPVIQLCGLNQVCLQGEGMTEVVVMQRRISEE